MTFLINIFQAVAQNGVLILVITFTNFCLAFRACCCVVIICGLKGVFIVIRHGQLIQNTENWNFNLGQFQFGDCNMLKLLNLDIFILIYGFK